MVIRPTYQSLWTIFFLIKLFNEVSLDAIVQEQYYLARKAGISLMESSMIPDFEREAYVNMLLKDLKDEMELEKAKYKIF